MYLVGSPVPFQILRRFAPQNDRKEVLPDTIPTPVSPRRGKGYVSSPSRGRSKVGVTWWIAFLTCSRPSRPLRGQAVAPTFNRTRVTVSVQTEDSFPLDGGRTGCPGSGRDQSSPIRGEEARWSLTSYIVHTRLTETSFFKYPVRK